NADQAVGSDRPERRRSAGVESPLLRGARISSVTDAVHPTPARIRLARRRRGWERRGRGLSGRGRSGRGREKLRRRRRARRERRGGRGLEEAVPAERKAIREKLLEVGGEVGLLGAERCHPVRELAGRQVEGAVEVGAEGLPPLPAEHGTARSTRR